MKLKQQTRDLLLLILDEKFDLWFSNRLKTHIYPQYSNIKSDTENVTLPNTKNYAYDELHQMIGLTNVKEVIGQALDYCKAQKLFKDKGMRESRPSMHMIFSGNPGTAKTTVARLFSQIAKENNLLAIEDLYECGRADLVGKYIGWTANLIRDKFKEAKGSILLIDEAYSLVDERNDLYGDEAINAIVQEMENNREDTIVIFAGYPDKMNEFVNKNPGLNSRIAFHVHFDDYNAEELFEITKLMADKEEITLGKGVEEELLTIFDTVLITPDFGNGRYARNLFEKAKMKQASRLLKSNHSLITKKDVSTLIKDDFEVLVQNNINFVDRKPIGFLST